MHDTSAWFAKAVILILASPVLIVWFIAREVWLALTKDNEEPTDHA